MPFAGYRPAFELFWAKRLLGEGALTAVLYIQVGVLTTRISRPGHILPLLQTLVRVRFSCPSLQVYSHMEHEMHGSPDQHLPFAIYLSLDLASRSRVYQYLRIQKIGSACISNLICLPRGREKSSETFVYLRALQDTGEKLRQEELTRLMGSWFHSRNQLL